MNIEVFVNILISYKPWNIFYYYSDIFLKHFKFFLVHIFTNL